MLLVYWVSGNSLIIQPFRSATQFVAQACLELTVTPYLRLPRAGVTGHTLHVQHYIFKCVVENKGSCCTESPCQSEKYLYSGGNMSYVPHAHSPTFTSIICKVLPC